MKKITNIGIITFMVLAVISFSALASGSGLSTDQIMLSYVDFNASDVTLDGKADETGFFTFTITTNNGKVINVAFRQNGEDMHVVLTSTNQGWLAIGWHNSKPSSTSGAGPMVDANIITGGNNVARDDTGSYATHSADTTNNIINYTSTVDSSGAKFEFLFPLASTDSVDQPLKVKDYGYFIFAAGISADIEDAHSGSQQAWYVPNVYIQSSDKEAYVKPSGGGSAPFADPTIILASLAVVAVFTKLKKK